MKTGIFRFVQHGYVADRLDQGWRYLGAIHRPHGYWSALMWWCAGHCEDGEAP